MAHDEENQGLLIGDRPGTDEARWPLLFLPVSLLVLVLLHVRMFADPLWLPIHDTLTQYTEFLYALAAFKNGELPLWNSYWTGGQPFYLLLNHGLLLDPLQWIWIALGTGLGLTATHTYLCIQLSSIAVFALGGFFLARLLAGSTLAGTAAFIILLFSGPAGSWVTQVYALHVIMYVPWVLYVSLRYILRPSLPRAGAAVAALSVAMNTYYPAYLFTFLVALGILLAVLYRQRLAALPYRRIARHALIAVPVLSVLLLPTYLIYREISADYYQIARYDGPAQQEAPAAGMSLDPEGLLRAAGMFAIDIVTAHNDSHADSIPLAGAVAITLALFEVVSRSRRAVFWSLALLFMVLQYLGKATPVHDLSRIVIPFYRIIGATPFFSGFVVLCTAMLAALGMERAGRRLPDRLSTAPGPAAAARALAPFVLPAAAVLAAVAIGVPSMTPAYLLENGAVLGVLAGMAVFAMSVVRSPRAAGHIAAGLLLTLCLAAGGLNIRHFFTFPLYTVRAQLFSNSSTFHFSPVRPDDYVFAWAYEPVGGECCKNFYHLAERFDAPYHFDRWQSLHTLIMPRAYYDAADFRFDGERWSAGRPGFAELMRVKFHWFQRYAVDSRQERIGAMLAQGVLPLPDDRDVRFRDLRTDPDAPGPDPLDRYTQAPLTVLRKTANTLSLSVEVDRPMFLLYTDLYHPGFKALVDGEERPILPAMGIFKAVELETGRHTVEFRFEPRYRFVLVLYLLIAVPTVVAFAGSSILALVPTRNKRPPCSSPDR